MRRCTICIIPETAKGIIFDNNGVCQLCKNYTQYEIKGEEALKNDIYSFINLKDKPNSIVPVSGGRDSSYALYYAKTILKLNPIAVHNDNDFETEIANINLENITKSLDVPLVRIRTKKRMAKKVVAEKFRMNAPFGAGLIASQTCEACEYGYESAVYNVARKDGLKVIIWGDSIEESTSSFYELTPLLKPTKSKRLFSSGRLNYIKHNYYFRKMKSECGSNLPPEGLQEIHLYDYIKWDRKDMVKTIEEKLGWTKPDNSPTSWRVDCHLTPLVNYLTKKAYGVSKIELGFSQMIRNGKMSREKALEQAEAINDSMDIEQIRNFLKNLGISDHDINRVI